jgi:transketolase
MRLLSEFGYTSADTFEFGKGRIVKKGNDLVLIGTGETVQPALEAAELLAEKQGIQATVVSMHTIKPLDYDLLADLAALGTPIVTVEEHMVYGGLGEACASFLLQNGFHNRFKIMGIPDEYTVTGSQLDIFRHYGISASGIAETAIDLMK